MIASDRKLKTTIKKNLRGLQAIEVSFKQNEQLEEKETEIINGYCEEMCIRDRSTGYMCPE